MLTRTYYALQYDTRNTANMYLGTPQKPIKENIFKSDHKQNIYTFLWRRLSALLSLRGPRGTFVHKQKCRTTITQFQASTMDNHRAQSPRQTKLKYLVSRADL